MYFTYTINLKKNKRKMQEKKNTQHKNEHNKMVTNHFYTCTWDV